MNRVAWLSYALLALAHGRIYERCELARDLLSFGINPDDVATWVCIAYHESRFDTSANNLYSGDHGIFQISELFWCGPGKACDMSCSALRDEDISNDLQCALQIHEEHTRLQGNGFLAWVVYPQHCKHNTKKYLVDCDISAKNYVPITRPRFFVYGNRYFPSYDYHHNVEELLPPYLAIGNIIRANYGKVLDLSKNSVDWYNYKVNNIDELKLLTSYIKPKQQVTQSTTTPEPTETTKYIPPVVPWRTIETNQFRHKNMPKPEATTQLPTQKEYTTVTPKNATTQLPLNIIETRTSTVAPTTPIPTSSKTMDSSPTTPSTTITTEIVKSTLLTSRVTYKWRPTAITPKPFTLTTIKEPSSTSRATTRLPTSERSTVAITETSSSQTIKNISTKTVETPTTRRYTPRLNTVTKTSPSPTTTKLTSTTELSTTTSTTTPPTDVLPIITKPTRTTPEEYKTDSRSTRKPKTNFSRYTFTSRTASTTATPATTKSQQIIQTTTSRSTESPRTTPRLQTTRTPRPTQSIFDLYLNPTKPPKLNLTRLILASNPFSIKIFANGTTTPAPPITRYRTKTSQQIRLDDKIDKLT